MQVSRRASSRIDGIGVTSNINQQTISQHVQCIAVRRDPIAVAVQGNILT
jgi:hypothetical protein